MPRHKLYVGAKTVSFYADAEVYRRLKLLLERQGKTVSEELNALMRRRLAELEGSPMPLGVVEYAEIKRQHERIVDEGKRLEAKLAKTKDYDDVKALALELGLDFGNFSNLTEIIPKLLANWQGPVTYVHRFITLLEMGKQAKELERRLSEVRIGVYSSNGRESGQADASACPVQGAESLSEMRENRA